MTAVDRCFRCTSITMIYVKRPSLLLCQCAHTFGEALSCCDDTATDNEVITNDAATTVAPAWCVEKVSSIWREVSLDALDATKLVKYYSKVFCEEVMWVMEQAGMVLATNITADDAVAAEDVTTMTDATEVLNDFFITSKPTTSPVDAAIAATTLTTTETEATSVTAATTEKL